LENIPLGKKFFLTIIIAIAIYSTIILLADIQKIYIQLSEFDLKFIPLILLAIFTSWFILYIRWNILLKKQNIKIPFKTNILIYFSGFSFAISPGKSGEFIKSIIIKKKLGIKKSTTIPIIFLERYFDMIGTAIVASFSILVIGIHTSSIVIIVISLFVLIFLIAYKNSFQLLMKPLKKISFFSKYASSFENMQMILKQSQTPKTIFTCTSLTIIYRFIEAIGIFLIIISMDVEMLNYLITASTYSLSIIIGTISFSPGGLGITEGSFAGLLSLQGLDISQSFTLAIIVRIFTLWVAVIIGFISLHLISRKNSV
jgi:uncharacterized protein (TIRG00374 family)